MARHRRHVEEVRERIHYLRDRSRVRVLAQETSRIEKRMGSRPS
jgi:hypothetical protein